MPLDKVRFPFKDIQKVLEVQGGMKYVNLRRTKNVKLRSCRVEWNGMEREMG